MWKKLTEVLANVMFKNDLGLSGMDYALLKLDFGKLNKVRQGLGDRVFSYVETGEGDTVLDELRRTQGCSQAMGFARTYYGLYGPSSGNAVNIRRRVLSKLRGGSIDFCVRLAQTYDVISSGSRYLRLEGIVPSWLETFLCEVVPVERISWQEKKQHPPVPFASYVVEEMLKRMGCDPEILVRAAIQINPDDYGAGPHRQLLTRLSGFGQTLTRYPEAVLEMLRDRNFRYRMQALNLMFETRTPIEPFQQAIADLAVSGSRQVREAAERLIKAYPDRLLPLIQEKLATGKPEERGYASTCLIHIGGKGFAGLLEEQLKGETSEKAREQIERSLGRRKANAKSGIDPVARAQDFGLPPVEPVNPVAPLSADACQALKGVFHEYNDSISANKVNRFYHAQPVSFLKIEQAVLLLQGKTSKGGSYAESQECSKGMPQMMYVRSEGARTEFLTHPDIQLIHAIRFGLLGWQGHPGYWPNLDDCISQYNSAHGTRMGLRELDAVFSALKMEPEVVATMRLLQYYPSLKLDDDLTWPYFAENPGVLRTALGYDRESEKKIAQNADTRRRALEIIAMFPEVPIALTPLLWDIALGPRSKDRALAIQILDKLPDKEPEIKEAVKSRKQDARASAAEWLGRLGCKDAIPLIESALKKEKSDIARAAMMNALETLGVPFDQIVDREELLGMAGETLKRGIPLPLSWFRFDALPSVRWRDSGEEIPRDVVTWWLLQHNKVGVPEPGPLLVRYCDMMRQDDREALGRFMIQEWIAHDTKPLHTREEALQETEKVLSKYAQHYKTQADRDEAFRNIMSGYLSQMAGSAIGEKGLLAVAGACGGMEVVRLTEGYLKERHGRSAQCKAMIKMLAYIEHPLAIQLLLSVAARYRTRGIREEAQTCVQEMAERKGWTIDQLSDRTIPTAGFDERAELPLEYGSRTFTARMGSDFKISIFNPDGNPVSSLPDARKDDDDEMVKEAKAALTAARKELKSILKLQKERLHEAMCTQRGWSFEEWNTYLHQHPIVRHYCQGLVWSARQDEDELIIFRPLDDGTFTDIDDNEVHISSDAVVRLAHGSLVTSAVRDAWIHHLKDYEIEPVFDQFERQPYILPEDKRTSTEITDFEGYKIEGLKLRSKLESMEYNRSQAEDGGWICEFQKPFPSLGIEAAIQFSGMSILASEQRESVALTSLCFTRLPAAGDPQRQTGGYMMLGDIPPVLLSECWNDMKTAADSGSGFDPNWHKNVI